MAAKGNGKETVRKIARTASTVMIAVGFAAVLLINVQDWVAQVRADSSISSVVSVYNDIGDDARREIEEQALAYNAQLAGNAAGDGVLPYEQQLIYMRDPMIAYIDIPEIAVRLPIFHGTSDDNLFSGVGHLESSSLPIGGGDVHCVLLGHSGMSNTRMFDDLHKLEPGDRFTIWTLNKPYAYEVTGTETVLPDEVEGKIGIRAGEDLVTLITCTPYGVNSHRLLVHAARCPYVEPESPGMAAYVNGRSLPLMALAAVLAGSAIAGAAIRRVARAGRSGESNHTKRR